MGEAVKRLTIINTSGVSENILNTIEKRRLSELVFGFCGAIGAGVSTIASKLEKELVPYNYKVKRIKISDLLIENLDKYKEKVKYTGDVSKIHSDKNIRGKVLQDLVSCAVSYI